MAITGAEVLTVFLLPLAGIISHVVVLTALLVHGLATLRQPSSRLLLGLTLAPITRILSLAMPLQNFPQILWFPLIYGPLLAGAVAVILNLRLSPTDIGLRLGRMPIQIGVTLAGPLLGLIEYLILAPDGLVSPPFTWQGAVVPSLIMVATTGFVEELIFRGILQKLSRDIIGAWGWVYVSVLFAVLHLGFLAIADVLFVFAVAVLFSWVAKKSGSLLGVSLSHGLANAFLYIVIPGMLTV